MNCSDIYMLNKLVLSLLFKETKAGHIFFLKHIIIKRSIVYIIQILKVKQQIII